VLHHEVEALMQPGDNGSRSPLQRLLDALRIQEPWRAEAACAETSVNFFPRHVSPRTTMMAKEVCQSCAVKAECLAYAFEHDLAGVWGGTTESQRRAKKRAKAA
jgi:WhiB family redox-sensing transcriptional regulator